MKLPSYNELKLFPEQLAVYEQPPDASMLVVGPPGSGKTSMAIWRARLLASLGQNVILVTRNRLLASVAGQLAREDGHPSVQVTTMHRLVSNDYYTRFGQYIPQSQPFQFVWDEVLATYRDKNVQPLVDHLIIDEGQNLPPKFFPWATRFGARAVSIFADEGQSTLEGDGSRASDFKAAGFPDALFLSFNHRNSPEIARVTEFFHQNRYLAPATPVRGASFDIPHLLPIADWQALANTVATRATNRGEAIGVIVTTQAEVENLAGLLRIQLSDKGVRLDTFTSDATQGSEYAIRMRDPGITVITGESAIGLEFDTLYLQDLHRSLPATEALSYRRLYMLSARARDRLVLVDGPQRLTAEQLASLPSPPILTR